MSMLKNRRLTILIFLNILGFVMALSPLDFMTGGGLFLIDLTILHWLQYSWFWNLLSDFFQKSYFIKNIFIWKTTNIFFNRLWKTYPWIHIYEFIPIMFSDPIKPVSSVELSLMDTIRQRQENSKIMKLYQLKNGLQKRYRGSLPWFK